MTGVVPSGTAGVWASPEGSGFTCCLQRAARACACSGVHLAKPAATRNLYFPNGNSLESLMCLLNSHAKFRCKFLKIFFFWSKPGKFYV